MINHSPGPWTVDEQTGVVYDSSGKPVQTGGAGCPVESQHNAVLIAAAPELLAELRSAHSTERCVLGMGCDTCRLINRTDGR